MCNFCKNKSIDFINLYQRTISPDHSNLGKDIYPCGYCKFTPTCSEYTKIAIIKYGFSKGWRKGIWRILRCNPWNKGGIDNP